MTHSNDYSFPRYLSAKKTVDDRALNAHVWQTFSQALIETRLGRPLQILEIGAGTGAMIQRILAWGGLVQAEYTALDALPENIAAARQQIPGWAAQSAYTCQEAAPGSFELLAPGRQVRVCLETIDLFDFIQREQGQRGWDFLIAHAFLDLMDIPTTLSRLFPLLEPGGQFYFTINFDGLTLFEPAIDPELDGLVEQLYHQTMDQRQTAGRPSGDSRAGRHLFGHLKNAGAAILASGASDWVVFAGPDGRYPHDEAYFLHFIVHTIEQALSGNPQLDPACFAGWINQRHSQIERGELVYMAHQLDFAGRVAGSGKAG